ncbi:MAG: YigZ family protein [Syntrophomonadaceae bacterium]|nr:YigZ family protein [Syntrophomonadaceae bacterium]
MAYYTISDPITFELVEKRSRFICILSSLIEPQDIENSLQAVGQKYPGDGHYCVAYRLRQDSLIMECCSDDGEPNGTAGSPILNVLQKRELEDIIAVVVRYFGGTLLGTGGLVRAYTQVVQSAVNEAQIVSQEYSEKIFITLDYSHYGSFEKRFLKSLNQVTNIEYADRISLEAWIALEKLPRFMAEVDNLTGGTASIELLGKGFVLRR